MEDLYNIMYTLCKEKGVSGGKMCADLGMSRAFMTELKSGRSKSVTLKTAQKLAEYFGVPIETFTGETTETEEIQDELFEKRKLLFDLSGKASKEELEMIIKMVKGFVDG